VPEGESAGAADQQQGHRGTRREQAASAPRGGPNGSPPAVAAAGGAQALGGRDGGRRARWDAGPGWRLVGRELPGHLLVVVGLVLAGLVVAVVGHGLLLGVVGRCSSSLSVDAAPGVVLAQASQLLLMQQLPRIAWSPRVPTYCIRRPCVACVGRTTAEGGDGMLVGMTPQDRPPVGRPPTPPRSAAAWVRAHPRVVDVVLAAVALAVAVAGADDRAQRGPDDDLRGAVDLSAGHTAGVVVLLVLAAVALLLRRDRPVPVAGVVAAATAGTALLGAGDPLVCAPLLLAMVTVGRRRTPLMTSVVFLGAGLAYLLALAAAQGAFLDQRGDSPALSALALAGAAAAAGSALRGQRSALDAAHARAAQAEATREEEAQRRVTDERLRIARELHDVVAHHIAVINVQAGVARHLLTSDPEQARAALGLVRDASKTVLTELSSVLGLLRTEDGGAPAEPAPGLTRLPALVDSLRGAGLDLTWSTTGPARPLPAIADLTAFRVVQEGLTNALRYGTGTATLLVEHRPEGVTVEVRNPLHPAPPTTGRQGGGHGLIGVRERTEAAGGWSTAGPNGDGDWVLRAGVPGDRA
jgi:signal transduction histidine kinase